MKNVGLHVLVDAYRVSKGTDIGTMSHSLLRNYMNLEIFLKMTIFFNSSDLNRIVNLGIVQTLLV